MRAAFKINADFCPAFASVNLYNAALNALEGAFNHHNAVVFIKAHKRRANLRPQSQKMLNNGKIPVAQRHNISIAVQKVVKIRQLLKLRQRLRIHLIHRLHNNIRGKHRLQLLNPLPLAPYRKLPGKKNKIVLGRQFRIQLLKILNKNPLPPRGYLNNIILHRPPIIAYLFRREKNLYKPITFKQLVIS